MREFPNSRNRGSLPSEPHSRSVPAVVNAGDRSAKRIQTLVNSLVSALDLSDVVDEARSLSTERCQQHCHSGSDVWRFEKCAAEPRRTMNKRTMRIAENDSCAHRREFVDEEHARLEHLLVHENQPLALSRGHDCDRHRIGRERRPRLVLELWNVAPHVGLYLSRLFGGNDQVVSVLDALYAESRETHPCRPQMLDARVLDS